MLPYLSTVDVFDSYKNKDAIKNMLAVLIIKVVQADNKRTIEEETKILDFYKQNFNMNEDEIIRLFIAIKQDNKEILIELEKLDVILNEDSKVKAELLHYINSVILCDGCIDEEYVVFEKIRFYLD